LLSLALSSCSSLPPGVVSREDLFIKRENRRVELSPDGRRIAYLHQDGYEVKLMVRSRDVDDSHEVVFPSWEIRRGFGSFFWHPDGQHLLYWQDNKGDEKYRLMEIDLNTEKVYNLTPFEGSRASLLASSTEVPDQLLITTNSRLKSYDDVYRVFMKTGKIQREYANEGDVEDWIVDRQLRIQGLLVQKRGGRTLEILMKDGPGWKKLPNWPAQAKLSGYLGISSDNKRIWVRLHYGADTARIVEIDLETGKHTLALADPRYDVGGLMLNTERTAPMAYFVERDKPVWLPQGQAAAHFKRIREALLSDFYIESRDRKDTSWIVRPESDRTTGAFYLYQPPTGKLEFLYHSSEELEKQSLRPMGPIHFKARDGMELFGYLTLPVDQKLTGPGKIPMVLLVHGGPWSRDTWGFEDEVQWLATRGYAVLQVNFRGSSGYGLPYLEAGKREWGGKMLTDLIDAKHWAEANWNIDPKRVCISGASYGGYAVLTALTQFPSEFACGVAEAGISDLPAFLTHVPPWWNSSRWRLDDYVGRVGRDDAFLASRSPIHAAEKVEAPLLIIHGENDPRCTPMQAENMVAELKKHGKDVRSLMIPDLGHEWATDVAYRVEGFLGEFLHGYVESPSGAELRFDNSR
jgi:dipeptidyl aminopeptidase/acylaminoacyl peptidase